MSVDPSNPGAAVLDRHPDSLSLMLDLYFDAHNAANPDAEALSPLAFGPQAIVMPWEEDHLSPRVRPLYLGEAQQLFPVHHPDMNIQAMTFVAEVQPRFDEMPTMISWIVEPGKADIVLDGPEFTNDRPLEDQGLPEGPDRDTYVTLLRDTLRQVPTAELIVDSLSTAGMLTSADFIGITMYPRRELIRAVQ